MPKLDSTSKYLKCMEGRLVYIQFHKNLWGKVYHIEFQKNQLRKRNDLKIQNFFSTSQTQKTSLKVSLYLGRLIDRRQRWKCQLKEQEWWNISKIGQLQLKMSKSIRFLIIFKHFQLISTNFSIKFNKYLKYFECYD